MSLEDLIASSRRYGSDTSMVLLGGGNTSFKDGKVLYVKASGHALASIGAEGFVKMDLDRMEGIWKRTYPDDDDERENMVLADMMACRLPGEQARPSVEALLHAVLPFPYVIHLHPSLVNGVTCSQDGSKVVAELFPDALWVELVKPGYILAETVRSRMLDARKRTGKDPQVIFLQNHGIFVSGNTLDEIDALYRSVFNRIRARLVASPDFSALPMACDAVETVFHALSSVCSDSLFCCNTVSYAARMQDEASFESVASAFTPDHIVYSGFKPLWISSRDFGDKGEQAIAKGYLDFAKRYKSEPKVLCVQGLGVFSRGKKALALFRDTVTVATYSESFGGPRFMDEQMIAFIRNWEVEKYRSSVAGT